MNHEEIVRAAIGRVLADTGRSAGTLSDDMLLGAEGLGLDSLDLATIVARLDGDLGIDPFASGSHAFRTLGEFIALYQTGAGK